MKGYKVFLAGLFAGFFLGMGVFYVFLREKPRKLPALEEQVFDPFAEARKMQEEMEKAINLGGNSQQIEVREDEKWIFYEIRNADAESLHVSIKSGMLVVSGEIRQSQGGAVFTSSFHRMISLPPNIDPNGMETISEVDKVILRFPKI